MNGELCLYEIDKIVKKRKNMYLIKWTGYPSSENTWEPEENIAHSDKFLEFQRRQRKTPAAKGEPKKKRESKKQKTEDPPPTRPQLAIVDPCMWVQCDSCGKWRAFPTGKDASTLFELKKIENAVFKCIMTPGDYKINCSTPEFGQGAPPTD